jgi:hypothetical protein
MNENIDVLIERKETELSLIRQRMEDFKGEFIKETIGFASEWYKKTAKEYVAKYTEVILSMKEEKIARMKAQVNELIESAEKTVRAELEKPALWWHQRPRLHDSISQYLQVSDKYPEVLDRAVRHVLGRLGLILEEYRYAVTTSGNTGSYLEFWFDKPHGDDSVVVPYYPHLLKWSGEMQDTIHKYNELYTEAMSLYMKIQKLKDRKKQQQAISRWDAV